MFHYCIIRKEDNLCVQEIFSMVPGWSIDNETDFSVEVYDSEEHIGKYFRDGVWSET